MLTALCVFIPQSGEQKTNLNAGLVSYNFKVIFSRYKKQCFLASNILESITSLLLKINYAKVNNKGPFPL